MSFMKSAFATLSVVLGVTACSAVGPSRSLAAITGSGVFVSDSGQSIRADYRRDDTVTLTFQNGTTKVLQRAISASGARYAANASEWWEHQGQASYSVNEQPVFIGKLQN